MNLKIYKYIITGSTVKWCLRRELYWKVVPSLRILHLDSTPSSWEAHEEHFGKCLIQTRSGVGIVGMWSFFLLSVAGMKHHDQKWLERKSLFEFIVLEGCQSIMGVGTVKAAGMVVGAGSWDNSQSKYKAESKLEGCQGCVLSQPELRTSSTS